MAAVVGCFLVSMYLSCEFNPLSTGSYPDVAYLAFPKNGEVFPGSFKYDIMAWGNLIEIDIGGDIYSCAKGQCFITLPAHPTHTHSPAGFIPSLSVSSPRKTPGTDYDVYKWINTKNEPEKEYADHETFNSVEVNPDEINPTTASLTSKTQPQPNCKNVSCLYKEFVGSLKKLKDSAIKKIQSHVEKELQAELNALKTNDNEMVIGFASALSSIPIFGIIIFIGVKIYKKNYPTELPVSQEDSRLDVTTTFLSMDTDEEINEINTSTPSKVQTYRKTLHFNEPIAIEEELSPINFEHVTDLSPEIATAPLVEDMSTMAYSPVIPNVSFNAEVMVHHEGEVDACLDDALDLLETQQVAVGGTARLAGEVPVSKIAKKRDPYELRARDDNKKAKTKKQLIVTDL